MQPCRWEQTRSPGVDPVMGTALCPAPTDSSCLWAWVSHFTLQNQNQSQNTRYHGEACKVGFTGHEQRNVEVVEIVPMGQGGSKSWRQP